MSPRNPDHAKGDYDIEKAKEKILETIDKAENELKALALAAKPYALPIASQAPPTAHQAPPTALESLPTDKKGQENKKGLRLADDELCFVSERKTKKKKNKKSRSGKSKKSGRGKKEKKKRKEKKEKEVKIRKTSSEERQELVQRSLASRATKRILHDAQFIQLANGDYRLFFDVPAPVDRLEQQHQVNVDFRRNGTVRVRIDGHVYR